MNKSKMIASKDAKPFQFSPTYFEYWVEQPKLETYGPKALHPRFDVFETKRQGKFGNYIIHSYIKSKELYPLVFLLHGFKPNEKIGFEYKAKEYELDALAYCITSAVAIRVGVDDLVAAGFQNNDPYYIETYEWKKFQEIFKQSGEQFCLYDCLVFPEISGQPIRALLPWFMIKETS